MEPTYDESIGKEELAGKIDRKIEDRIVARAISVHVGGGPFCSFSSRAGDMCRATWRRHRDMPTGAHAPAT